MKNIISENDKLLLQDLIGRQLYGVKFQCVNLHGKKVDQILESVVVGGEKVKILGNKEVVDLDNCKPYLYSKKCIEGEIYLGGKKVCVLDMLAEKDIVIVQHKGTWLRAWEYDIIDFRRYYDELDKCHIDYRDLISENLAIEVTSENNPYK